MLGKKKKKKFSKSNELILVYNNWLCIKSSANKAPKKVVCTELDLNCTLADSESVNSVIVYSGYSSEM